ncbi:MAG: DUF5010 domain-containing protein [Prolixibacteraceae bacterium]|nr:DUF5010 domain-containing protein [Prolixibacteraceae bacterium]
MQLRAVGVMLICVFAFSITLKGQFIGSITCFNDKERAGGNMYPYNQSLFLSETGEAEWWDNIVEEIYHSGIDFSALLCRGYSPGRPSMDMGDPRKIPNMMEAMDRRGLSNEFKLAIFDDCPAGWTANHNYDQGRGHNTNTRFDCRDTTNYKYIWDYNLKISIENIPDERRFKIDGRMVIIFWQVNDSWMKNMDFGNLKKILAYIRTECQKEFGFNPYLVVQDRWFDFDTHLRTEHVDAVHNWFSAARGVNWTLHEANDTKFGVVAPGFAYDGDPKRPFIDSRHGEALIEGMEGTVNSGALITLCEGFTDAAETASYWRSKDTTYYDYPNQRIDILRRYSQNAFLNMRMVQVEACDFFHDVTPGNEGGTFRAGDLDICKTTDAFGGWNVFDAELGEWMEWKELPIPQNGLFEIRYAAEQEAQIQFIVGDQEGEILTLEPTGDDQTWALAKDTSFNVLEDSHHNVKLKVVSGNVSLNYFNILSENAAGKVAVLSPAKGRRMINTDTLNIKAETIGFANEIDSMEVSINNELLFKINSANIDTAITDLPLGDSFIKIKAVDVEGNVAIDSSSIFVGEHRYQINDSIIGEGTVSFDPPGGSYVEGTVVTVRANTNYPSYFIEWSGDTISAEEQLEFIMTKDIDLTALFGTPDDNAIKVNFQPEDTPVPEGYLKDFGLEFGTHDYGQNYGWVGGSNMSSRNRDATDDVRYSTLIHMEKGDNNVWEIEVENGTYMVYLVMGDPSFTDQINSVNIEGVYREDDQHIENFDEFRVVVEVKDNHLTIAPGEGSENAKICFVDISEDNVSEVDSINTSINESSLGNSLKFELEQNYPNPFTYETQISFNLPKEGNTLLRVYNSEGRKVATVVNGTKRAGLHEVTFNADGLPGGVYYYHLQSAESALVKKMLLIK